MNKKICPKCKSEDINYKPTAEQVAIGTRPQTHKCNKCSYEGNLFLEKEEEI